MVAWSREMTRMSLGAGRRGLIQQMLVEGTLLASLAGGAARCLDVGQNFPFSNSAPPKTPFRADEKSC